MELHCTRAMHVGYTHQELELFEGFGEDKTDFAVFSVVLYFQEPRTYACLPAGQPACMEPAWQPACMDP